MKKIGKTLVVCTIFLLLLPGATVVNALPYIKIGDFVWEDLNANGIQDIDEPGIEGVTVELYKSGIQIYSTITDVNGYYIFDQNGYGLSTGDYYVLFEAPMGYTFTNQNQGTDDTIDSDADPLTGQTHTTTLWWKEQDFTLDAGLVLDDDDCGPCEGKVTQLTLQYNGGITDATIKIKQKKNGEDIFYNINTGDQLTVYGKDKKGTLGTEIKIYVNDVENTKIHTSCSKPIGPGLISGDFEVTEGYSKDGGLLCPI